MIDLRTALEQGFILILLVIEAGVVLTALYCILYGGVIAYKELKCLIYGKFHYDK